MTAKAPTKAQTPRKTATAKTPTTDAPRASTNSSREFIAPKPTGFIFISDPDGKAPDYPDGIFYDYNRLFSKNRLFNFIVSIKGSGKTFGAICFAIRAFINHRKKSIWMRREGTELGTAFLMTFFEEIADFGLFPDYDFLTKTIQGSSSGMGQAYMRKKGTDNWEQFILFVPLNSVEKNKSTTYSKYWYIWFDEFLLNPLDSSVHYINGAQEPYKFKRFYDSVARLRDNVRAIFIGNAESTTNPYFEYFGLKWDYNREWIMSEDSLIHNFDNAKFREYRIAHTRFGKAESKTEYGQFALYNKFTSENEDFIERRSKNSVLLYNIRYCNRTYGVFSDFKKGRIYITSDTDMTAFTYALTTEDMKPNYFLLDRLKTQTNPLTTLRKAYQNGYLRFDSQGVKQAFMEVINLVI